MIDEPIRLGALEARVMNILWENGPATVRDIIGHIETEPAYTTVATVLANLDKKALVSISRSRRRTTYAAGMSRAEFEARQMACVLQSSPDPESSMLHFVDAMNEADLEILREYLQAKAEGNA